MFVWFVWFVWFVVESNDACGARCAWVEARSDLKPGP